MKHTALLAGVALAAATAFASQASAIVALQGFSDGDFNNSNATFQTIDTGGTFGPWSVDSGSIDLIGGYWMSPSGPNAAMGGTNGSVDLDGNAPGSISQTFFATPGEQYILRFDLAGNPDGAPTTKTLDVNVTGLADPSYSFSVPTGATHDAMGYVPESMTFMGSGLTTVSFASTDVGTPYGPVIGNVSVSAAPEPATWALMFAGVGLVGGALRAGKRRGVLLSA